jgi:diaminopimelate epimerase
MPMKKTFVKMHGLGNDFAIFDGRKDGFSLSAKQIRALGNRGTGIGFDQTVVIVPPKASGTDAFLRIYNADGSEVGACGNATRCIADLLMREKKKEKVVLETKAGRLAAWRTGDKVTVDMGAARLDWQDIPLSREADTLSLPITKGNLKQPVAVNMGNPHAVFFVPSAESVALETLGPKIEHHDLFPERTNVEAAEVLSRKKIRMRVWERGTGITQACGTGACAVAVAGVRRGLADRKVEIVLDGGSLHIEWRESDGHVLMTGPAETAFTGEIDV